MNWSGDQPRLESVYASKTHRGFESPSLRKKYPDFIQQ